MSFQNCIVSEVDLFTPPPLQTSILSKDTVFYGPITSLDNCQVLEFFIPASSEHYRDLNSISLHLRVQLLKSSGALYATADTSQPGFVNNALHSLFKTATVYMNGKQISFIDCYNYKDYLDKIINYDSNAIETILVNEGFVKDSASAFDDIASANYGLVMRKTHVANSAMYDLVGKLNIDCFQLQKFMMSNVDIKICLALDSPSFFLMEKKDGKSVLKIHDAQLKINQYTLNPEILLEHSKRLSQGHKARYGFNKSDIKTFTLASGITSVSLDNIYSGRLPTNLVVALISNKAFSGTADTNPFNFTNHSVSSIGLYLNSKCVTQTPIEMVYSSNQFARAYANFFEGCGKLNTSQSNSIKKSEFKDGYCLYPFILSNSQLSECADPITEGVIRLEIKFATAPKETLTVLVYAEFTAQLEIDKSHNVSVVM